MKLYFAPGACSLSPHIIMREAGLNFDLEQVNNQEKKTKSGEDFWKVNPKGQVPVLELDNGEKLTEGPIVVQYLADQKPDSGLLKAGGDECEAEPRRADEHRRFATTGEAGDEHGEQEQRGGKVLADGDRERPIAGKDDRGVHGELEHRDAHDPARDALAEPEVRGRRARAERRDPDREERRPPECV